MFDLGIYYVADPPFHLLLNILYPAIIIISILLSFHSLHPDEIYKPDPTLFNLTHQLKPFTSVISSRFDLAREIIEIYFLKSPELAYSKVLLQVALDEDPLILRGLQFLVIVHFWVLPVLLI